MPSHEAGNPFKREHKASSDSDRVQVAKTVLGKPGERVMRNLGKRRGLPLDVVPLTEVAQVPLSAEERAELEEMILRPGEMVLTLPMGDHVPELGRLTSKGRDGYGFEDVDAPFKDARAFAEFQWTDPVIDGIYIPRPKWYSALLPIYARPEKRVVAKILDLPALIQKKQAEFPGAWIDYVNTDDILREMDELGYRPATCEELLAFAKERWKPGDDPSVTPEEEEALCGAGTIFAFGSMAARNGGRYSSPLLMFTNNKRFLEHGVFGSTWRPPACFLMVRK